MYSSAFASRSGPLGHGWSSSLDQAVWRERGKVVLLAGDGREIEFDTFDLPDHVMKPGHEVQNPIERLRLRCLEDGRWEIEDVAGVVREFGPVAGRDDGRAPIQRVRDFFAGRPSRGEIPSSYTLYSRGVVPTDLGAILPPVVLEALDRGLPAMDRRLGRLFLRDATLTAPESRGSSPVRIPRDPATRESPDVAGLYPCGEGAGYAGGIVSAAVDGLRTARALVARFAPIA